MTKKLLYITFESEFEVDISEAQQVGNSQVWKLLKLYVFFKEFSKRSYYKMRQVYSKV